MQWQPSWDWMRTWECVANNMVSASTSMLMTYNFIQVFNHSQISLHPQNLPKQSQRMDAGKLPQTENLKNRNNNHQNQHFWQNLPIKFPWQSTHLTPLYESTSFILLFFTVFSLLSHLFLNRMLWTSQLLLLDCLSAASYGRFEFSPLSYRDKEG